MDYDEEHNLYWRTQREFDQAKDDAMIYGFLFGAIFTVILTLGIRFLVGIL